ncbi:methyltransferase (plasmid) [Achromobacter seleniivolatilans]|uniref:Methyltransferase n=1 Tax=Achromobacter seleniivolatilans TaxID=3047478 RepID=A0ABY9MA51_9BURK|nr:methyltransferase [Achromobacter sp. R39]WMD23902.1 methyltransferase [Achromobacter sp. R39]
MQIDQSVLAVLSNARAEGNAVSLAGQLDRKLYERTDKVLRAAGGAWNRKARAHIFNDDAAARIEQIILTGEIAVPKDEFNYFPTPPTVAKLVLELGEIVPGMRVLEPSAGQGELARWCCRAGGVVDCYELMDENYAVLSQAPCFFAAVQQIDFLTVQAQPIYDRVIMNPPFMKQADVHHVMHAHKFLKPGGRLIAIMSAGVTFRENRLTVSFRELVRDRGGFIEALPEGSFKASGTMVNTVVVAIPA